MVEPREPTANRSLKGAGLLTTHLAKAKEGHQWLLLRDAWIAFMVLSHSSLKGMEITINTGDRADVMFIKTMEIGIRSGGS